jgi:hypothetical protein
MRLLPALLASGLLVGTVDPAHSQIIEERHGEANPMASVFKSTLFGGLAGLALGGAVELVKEDSNGDAAKWGLVIGTFFGFAYGVYHVASRPDPYGALNRDPDGFGFSLPRPTIRRLRPGPLAAAAGPGVWEIRAPLAACRF